MKREVVLNGKKIEEENTLICVPISGTSQEEVLWEIRKALETDVDVIEWRTDYFNEDVIFTLKHIKKHIGNKTLMFTFRTLAQGGKKENAYYISLLKQAIMTGVPHIIDIEICNNEEDIKEIIRLCKEKNMVTVSSSHYFDRTPSAEDIKAEYEKMENLGIDIPKIAVMPQSFNEVCDFMKTVYEVSENNRPMIGISMGSVGSISRLCSNHMGSCMTFSTILKSSAPGQLPIDYVKEFIEKTKG